MYSSFLGSHLLYQPFNFRILNGDRSLWPLFNLMHASKRGTNYRFPTSILSILWYRMKEGRFFRCLVNDCAECKLCNGHRAYHILAGRVGEWIESLWNANALIHEFARRRMHESRRFVLLEFGKIFTIHRLHTITKVRLAPELKKSRIMWILTYIDWRIYASFSQDPIYLDLTNFSEI